MEKVKNILTFDIEDNFTLEELVNHEDWGKYEGQVVENTRRILNLLEKYRIKATFFILAKVAERRPEIVKMILGNGHEIASHGYVHARVNDLGKGGFEQDVLRSKEILQAIAGKPPKGFRAMAFSIDADNMWALDILKEIGFLYDSSIVSSHYENYSDYFKLHLLDSFHEVPASAFRIFGFNIPFGGGIFFRIAPRRLIHSLIRHENEEGRPVLLYAHAWEFNKDQPKRKVSFLQSLAQSPITFTTPKRLESLFHEFSFTSIENYLAAQ